MPYQVGFCDDEVYQIKINNLFLNEIASKNGYELGDSFIRINQGEIVNNNMIKEIKLINYPFSSKVQNHCCQYSKSN